MQDRIINIDTRCEAPETDTYYEGARNAARAAEILNATCEPLVTTSDALPASVSHSATPSAECCHGRTAHGTEGRVVESEVRWTGTAASIGQYCPPLALNAPRPRCPHVVPCDPRDTYAVMWETLCHTPAEARRLRRNARRRELYRQRKAA